MGLKGILKLSTAAVVSLTLVAGTTSSANAVEKMKWKMQSAFGSKLSIIGEVARRYQDIIRDMSGGAMKIKFFEPGALVPTLECFDAASKGSLESCWTTPGYHTAKYPALSFFTTVPFGPQIGEFMAWKWFGGGNDLRQEIYDKHNLIAFDSFAIGPETSGWFKTEINSLDQIKGLKMRFFGLGAVVMSKLGVSTQLLAGADIYPALERGVIDATEFSMPSIDYDLGFYQIAKFNYFPGWHQQSSIGELLMNKAGWDALDKQQQAIITAGCGDSVTWSNTRSEALQFEAMAKLKAKGVTSVRWPDSDLDILRKAWEEVVVEESAKDPLFKEVAESYSAFRAKYKIWKDHGYLN